MVEIEIVLKSITRHDDACRIMIDKLITQKMLLQTNDDRVQVSPSAMGITFTSLERFFSKSKTHLCSKV